MAAFVHSGSPSLFTLVSMQLICPNFHEQSTTIFTLSVTDTQYFLQFAKQVPSENNNQCVMLELRFKTLMIAITQFPVLGIVFVQQPIVLQSV